jgi:hypothetical protein
MEWLTPDMAAKYKISYTDIGFDGQAVAQR